MLELNDRPLWITVNQPVNGLSSGFQKDSTTAIATAIAIATVAAVQERRQVDLSIRPQFPRSRRTPTLSAASISSSGSQINGRRSLSRQQESQTMLQAALDQPQRLFSQTIRPTSPDITNL